MKSLFNLLNAELNPICHLLALLGGATIVVVSRLRVKGRQYTGRFIMFSVITNIYNKKTKGPTSMELFIATGKLKKFFFDN